MAAYYHSARVAADRTHNNCIATASPQTPGIVKHVVMDTPSMQNVAAAARQLADVTNEAACCHRDEPGEERSLLVMQSVAGFDRQRHEYQLDLHTV